MNSTPRQSGLALVGARRQQGAIMVFAALAISVAVILISLADIGFLYYYKREYQKAADLAAMAGAKNLVSDAGVRSCDNAETAAGRNATHNLNGRAESQIVQCGKWEPSSSTQEGRIDTLVADAAADAIRVIISGRPPRFLPFIDVLSISASAIAVADQPLAALNIRSTLVDLDSNSNQQNLIRALCTLLASGDPGCITVAGIGSGGLADASVNLLTLIAEIDAGTYGEVLDTEVTLGQLLNATINALPQDDAAARAFLGNLNAVAANVAAKLRPLRLGDLVGVQTGTPIAGLDIGLNVLELALASVQAASRNCAVCADVPVNSPIVGMQIHASVIEPTQISAIGNPALAIAEGNPAGSSGPDRLYVNTAQVRVLASIDISKTTGVVTEVLAVITDYLGDVISALNPLVGGDLFGTVTSLGTAVQRLLTGILGCSGNCVPMKLFDNPKVIGKIDISIRAAHGSAYVNDYDCASGGSTKSLAAKVEKAIAVVSIGDIGTPSEVLSSQIDIVPNDITIIDLGYVLYRPKSCPLLGLGSCSGGEYCIAVNEGNGTCIGSWVPDKSRAHRVPALALKLRAHTSVGGTEDLEPSLRYEAPEPEDLPEINHPPAYQATPEVPIGNLLSQLNIQVETVPAVVGTTLNGVIAAIESVLENALTPLNGTVNALLDGLGTDLNKVEVGARLSCSGGGATLID